jgi:hypothetical protein
MSLIIKLDDNLSVELDSVSAYIASYLSWARKARVYTTLWPLISYRGHACEKWPLLPSLCRQKLPVEMLEEYEHEVINEFRNKFELSEWTDIEVLAYARHHGAPTRLLDWSMNPFVGLWFAVSEKECDSSSGSVFQLSLLSLRDMPEVISFTPSFLKLPMKEEIAYKQPVWVFSSPTRVSRTLRQRSVFSLASFHEGYVLKPLDQIAKSDKPLPIRKFPVPAKFKPELRRLLSDVGLDAYSIYGDPDSLGKALATHFDISDLNVPSELPREDAHLGESPNKKV